MGKTSATIKLIQVLSSRSDYVKTGDLAELIGTNPRNIKEYIKEIEECGYVIDSQNGLYGGYKLKNSTLMPTLNLSKDEKNEISSLLSYLKDNKNVAIVTDRGTPIISDPGYKTVKFLKEKGYNVIALPGATAFVPALVASSISSEHFTFYGFLSSKEKKMYDELNNLKDSEFTLVFYEAPHRIIRTLHAMLEVFGDRIISISREISKLHESVFVGYISEAIDFVPEKGEFVIVVEANNEVFSNDMSIRENVDMYIKSGLSSMDAIKRVARERKIPKNDVYKEYHTGEE